MGRIELSFHIEAPIEEVWDLGVTPQRIPQWQFDVVAVENAPRIISEVGQSYTLIYKRFGRRLPSTVKVTRLERRELVQIRGNTPLGGFFQSQTKMTSVSNGTHIDWKMDYRLPGWFLGSLLDVILFRSSFRRTVEVYNRNFRSLAEKDHLLSSDGG